MALEAGSRLGPYEIVEMLGSGGMGEVYRALDPRLEREVAIKVLPEGVADRKHLQRFEQEARAAGALNHPSVLAVHDVGTHEGAPYVVSELLQGHSLRARLEGGALPVRKALDLALQIAHGLAAAHDKGIVHRDLTPQNVFLTEDGRVKILDFGLAKLTRPEPFLQEGHATERTDSGMVIGTPGYMSPEQVRGEPVDHRSDIFSFGAVLYEMLSGARAFRRESTVETMNAILKEDPPEISEAARGISPAIVGLVRRCLEKRAPDRFHSAHDLALAVEAVSSGLSGPSSEQHRGQGVSRGVALAKRYMPWVALVAMMLAAGILYRVRVRDPPLPVAVIDSVAVLPFENVGGDAEREYLSDGIAESLINELSRRPDLKVIARSTSFRFRGSDVDPRKVGRDLGVGAVLTGRVSQRGDTLVIGAELVDVAQGTQLWGERYDTRMGDLIAVQDDIANDISRGLRLKLASKDEARLTRPHTESSEAYRLYLLSRHELNKPGPGGPRKSLEYAQQATGKDPTYAPAHAALARAYIRLGHFEMLPARQALSRAKAAATKALEIDQTLPEGHLALAHAVYLGWDWAGAQRGFERAIELDPNSADSHAAYGNYLVVVGRRPREGIGHLKKAVELDPMSAMSRVGLGWGYYFDRQYDEALGMAKEALEFGGDPHSLGFRAMSYREEGMYEEAIAEWRNPAIREGIPLLAHLGNTYARAGKVGEARECLRKLKEQSREGDVVGAYGTALIHAGLGERDEAFKWLETAYEERDKGMAYLRVDPALDPLRSDPRFQDLVRRMNFPS